MMSLERYKHQVDGTEAWIVNSQQKGALQGPRTQVGLLLLSPLRGHIRWLPHFSYPCGLTLLGINVLLNLGARFLVSIEAKPLPVPHTVLTPGPT